MPEQDPDWGWRAEFLDGPLGAHEHERHFSGAFQVATRLWFAKIDPTDHPSPATIGGWAMVGYEPGPGAPEVPWPEQVTYAIDLAGSSILAQPPRGGGGDRGVARYRLET